MILEQVVVLFPIVDLIDGVMVHWILKPEGRACVVSLDWWGYIRVTG